MAGRQTPSPKSFSGRLLEWHRHSGRTGLPWQRNPTPYRVWVSEIMLQQTQVRTVVPYYQRFIRRFPGVRRLAAAQLDEVLALWSGLGYYSRARLLHKAARIVCEEHGGRMPRDKDALTGLPGIGRSTAGAILSLACGRRHAILDGNVRRVLARHAGVDGGGSESRFKRALWELAERRLPQQEAGRYNQALMDLGALVCTPAKPRCGECPVMDDCRSYHHGAVELRPARRGQKSRPVREFAALVVVHRDMVLLERRPPHGIWGGLLSFPEARDVSQASHWCARRFGRTVHGEVWTQETHDLTHLRMLITPVKFALDNFAGSVADGDRYVWCKIDALSVGVPALVKRLLKRLDGGRCAGARGGARAAV